MYLSWQLYFSVYIHCITHVCITFFLVKYCHVLFLFSNYAFCRRQIDFTRYSKKKTNFFLSGYIYIFTTGGKLILFRLLGKKNFFVRYIIFLLVAIYMFCRREIDFIPYSNKKHNFYNSFFYQNVLKFLSISYI